MIDTKAIRDVALVTSDSERMQFKPSTVIALLDRLEAAEFELLKARNMIEQYREEAAHKDDPDDYVMQY